MRTREPLLVALLLAALPAATRAAPDVPVCRLQAPQRFLVRSSFVRKDGFYAEAHARALRYRVEKYGPIPDAATQAESTTFMGLPVTVHRKIVPALRCVQRRIERTCTRESDRYVPHALGGLREQNTYRGEEISNHLFGIAVDIDSDRNPCCGCAAPWPEHPLCKRKSKGPYGRTALTPCWVRSFGRYGFYRLGRDPILMDTMHFEFLGDPDRIAP